VNAYTLSGGTRSLSADGRRPVRCTRNIARGGTRVNGVAADYGLATRQFVSVTVAVPVFPSQVAVIVTVPAFLPLTVAL
jgi:hypothetical protein